MADERMIVYDALLEAEKGEESPVKIGRAMLDKYAYLDKHERAFMHFMYEGVIDKKITLDYVIDYVSSVPVRKMKKPIRCIIRMGAFQILFMDSVPDRAACNEAVNIAKKKHLNNLSGFINGVLRSISRLEGQIPYPDRTLDYYKYMSVYYSMPELIIKSLEQDYGRDRTIDILDNLNIERPLFGKCIKSKIDCDELIKKLNVYENVAVKRVEGLDAIEFETIDSLSDIDEFTDGYFTIQDISSQLVGTIAGISKNNKILDVCAAPGGKSIHAADILSSLNSDDGYVVACDISDAKIEKIQENIDRVSLDNIRLRVQDATILNEEDREKYDVVICDAPCSGLGIMGRKRDIKYGLSQEGFDELVNLQRLIIKNAVSYVKPGGTFIYSTCTMRKAENNEQFSYIQDELGLLADDFYDMLPDAYKSESAKAGYLQLFAGSVGTDGFFISKFHTRA